MKISAVIPCYNAAPFLRETLESILAQERPADEIIFVDDCSTDGSPDIASSIPGVTVVSQAKNSGCASSRNLGIQRASGDVIAIIDADDVWLPHHLRISEKALTQNPSAGFVFSQIYRFGDSDSSHDISVEAGLPLELFDLLLGGNFLPQPTVLFHRDLCLNAGGFDDTIRYCEDYDLWLQLSLRSKGVFTGSTTAGYRMHANQLNRHFPAMFRDTWHARRHALTSVRALHGADAAARVQARLGEVWATGLHTAWALRSRESMDMMLAMASEFPAQQEAYKQWRRRRAIWPLLATASKAADLLPVSIRTALRPTWGPAVARI